MSMTTLVGTQAATLTDPVPLRPTVKAFARSAPPKLMLDVPGQAPLGQIAANPLPSDWVTVRFPAIAIAFAGEEAADVARPHHGDKAVAEDAELARRALERPVCSAGVDDECPVVRDRAGVRQQRLLGGRVRLADHERRVVGRTCALAARG